MIVTCELYGFPLKRNYILGLAASLQARVLAQLKIEEEKEERQRRQDIPINAIPTNRSTMNVPLNTAQIKTEGMCELFKRLLSFCFNVNVSFSSRIT